MMCRYTPQTVSLHVHTILLYEIGHICKVGSRVYVTVHKVCSNNTLQCEPSALTAQWTSQLDLVT